MTRQILGDSPQVKALLEMIRKVAGAKTNVLIIGESGTGKELVARMIHDLSPMKENAFIPVNCGAIPENLIESELFGHKRGSFTGAVQDKTGLFEAAHGGTLFLDEVGELPLAMQVKLLRAIQERVIRRVGSNDDIKIDTRIIAATNRDLEQAVAGGTFREDLYYRLNVILIKTPPLRERKGDVRTLAEQFLKRIVAKQGKSFQRFDPDALAALEAYSWPGNVRELENIIERAVTLETQDRVTLQALPAAIASGLRSALRAGAGPVSGGSAEQAPRAGGGPQEIRLPAPDFTRGPLNLDQILGDIEKTYLLSALEHAGGVKKKAADLLGITFRSIRYRLKKLGVDSESDSGED